MFDYPELSIAREDMLQQSELYRPSAFWAEASTSIVQELCAHGVENFRRLPKPLGFFVPTYGSPGNSFSEVLSRGVLNPFRQQQGANIKPVLALEQFLGGQLSALSDYRVLLAADRPDVPPYLHTFTESTVGAPVEQFEFDGRKFSRSALNYLLGLAFLKKHLNKERISTVMEIGGGFGTLGEILSHSATEDTRYINLDIPPTSFAAQYYLSTALGSDQVATYVKTRNLSVIDIESLPKAAVLCAWQIEKLQGQIDLFVNFISFQEMEPHIVRNYLGQVERLGTRWVLLRNMREGKQKRKTGSVGVQTPITTDDYQAMLPAYKLVERNVHPFGYKTVDGYHSELMLFKRKA
jgi:putative sugar O-methyltransferase